MYVHLAYKTIEIHRFSRLTTIAKEVFEFFAIVTVETVHLTFRWLSSRTRIRFRFEFRDFKLKAWCWSINILITLIRLIRINDDSQFIISRCITEKFFTSWLIVHVSQRLIDISAHFDEFVQISRFVQLSNKDFLQFVKHLILEIFE
jgi:hypothetical protein